MQFPIGCETKKFGELYVAIRANKKCAKSDSSVHDSTVNSMLY